MRLLVFLFLSATGTLVHAQGYIRFTVGADASVGARGQYGFERFPERMPVPAYFSARFGGGWTIDAETGYRFTPHLEAALFYNHHGSSTGGASDLIELDSAQHIAFQRAAVLNADNRAGICVQYYFGNGKFQPFISAGVQCLLHPSFHKYYELDTTPVMYAQHRKSVYSEIYSGGFSTGGFISTGFAVNKGSQLSFFMRMKYTFHTWTPKYLDHSVVYNEYAYEEDLSAENPGITIPMNAFGVSLGVTCLLSKPDEERPPVE